jgi:hypothetical protein
VRVWNDSPAGPPLRVLLRRGELPLATLLYDVMAEAQGDGAVTLTISDAQPGVYYAVRPCRW